eukprot:SAG11_NODE_416_length_9669_cov_7.135528_7_plen_83_part_00
MARTHSPADQITDHAAACAQYALDCSHQATLPSWDRVVPAQTQRTLRSVRDCRRLMTAAPNCAPGRALKVAAKAPYDLTGYE